MNRPSRFPSWGKLRARAVITVKEVPEERIVPRAFSVDDFLDEEEQTDTTARTLAERDEGGES
jgi:hypothetical protein